MHKELKQLMKNNTRTMKKYKLIAERRKFLQGYL